MRLIEKLKGYMPKDEAERLANALHRRFELSSYAIEHGEDVIIYVNDTDMFGCFERNGWSEMNHPQNLPIPKRGDHGVYVQFDRYVDGQADPVHNEDGSLRTELFGHFAERVGIDYDD